MKGNRGLLLLFWILAFLPDSMAVGAQEVLERKFRVEAEPFYGTASLLWPISDTGWYGGPEVGLGLFEAVTLTPDHPDFRSIVHAGPVFNRDLNSRWSVDVGFRVGLGETLYCKASDCLPGFYGTFVTGLAFGGEHWRLGTRMLVGGQAGEAVLAWSPVFLRGRWGGEP